MEERPTTEITLSISKARVVLFNYLYNSQLRDIKRIMMEGATMTPTGISDFNPSVTLDIEDYALSKLIKEAYASDGTKVENIKEFIDTLHSKDGDELYDIVDKITADSTLTESAKKKLG